MLTMMKPGTMNPKQHRPPAGLTRARLSASPAPASCYPKSPVVSRGFHGSFDWRPYPGLF
ncbi:MAG: hypothetical protein ACXU86_09875 [Archangium sp.]